VEHNEFLTELPLNIPKLVSPHDIDKLIKDNTIRACTIFPGRKTITTQNYYKSLFAQLQETEPTTNNFLSMRDNTLLDDRRNQKTQEDKWFGENSNRQIAQLIKKEQIQSSQIIEIIVGHSWKKNKIFTCDNHPSKKTTKNMMTFSCDMCETKACGYCVLTKNFPNCFSSNYDMTKFTKDFFEKATFTEK